MHDVFEVVAHYDFIFMKLVEVRYSDLAKFHDRIQMIECVFQEADLNNYFSITHHTTKTKIILEFASLKKRKAFFFAGREEHRFYKNQRRDQQPRGQFRSSKLSMH
jgi:hypothetical protein